MMSKTKNLQYCLTEQILQVIISLMSQILIFLSPPAILQDRITVFSTNYFFQILHPNLKTNTKYKNHILQRIKQKRRNRKKPPTLKEKVKLYLRKRYHMATLGTPPQTRHLTDQTCKTTKPLYRS
jgi:hypothetical protein